MALDGMVKGEEGGTAIDGGRRGNDDYATWTPVGVPKQNPVVCRTRVQRGPRGSSHRVPVLFEGS